MEELAGPINHVSAGRVLLHLIGRLDTCRFCGYFGRQGAVTVISKSGLPFQVSCLVQLVQILVEIVKHCIVWTFFCCRVVAQPKFEALGCGVDGQVWRSALILAKLILGLGDLRGFAGLLERLNYLKVELVSGGAYVLHWLPHRVVASQESDAWRLVLWGTCLWGIFVLSILLFRNCIKKRCLVCLGIYLKGVRLDILSLGKE